MVWSMVWRTLHTCTRCDNLILWMDAACRCGVEWDMVWSMVWRTLHTCTRCDNLILWMDAACRCGVEWDMVWSMGLKNVAHLYEVRQFNSLNGRSVSLWCWVRHGLKNVAHLYDVRQFNSPNGRSVSLGCWVRYGLKHDLKNVTQLFECLTFQIFTLSTSSGPYVDTFNPRIFSHMY
jgi:hypothetical protein